MEEWVRSSGLLCGGHSSESAEEGGGAEGSELIPRYGGIAGEPPEGRTLARPPDGVEPHDAVIARCHRCSAWDAGRSSYPDQRAGHRGHEPCCCECRSEEAVARSCHLRRSRTFRTAANSAGTSRSRKRRRTGPRTTRRGGASQNSRRRLTRTPSSVWLTFMLPRKRATRSTRDGGARRPPRRLTVTLPDYPQDGSEPATSRYRQPIGYCD